jgi:3-phosphoshikimate 1-carboxyvinyltransferase
VATLGAEPSVLDGAGRLRQRPIDELVAALASLGGQVVTGTGGGLPLRAGGRRPFGRRLSVPAGRSSQFVSAQLLIGARLEGGLEVSHSGQVVSGPYIGLTASVLRAFGVVVERRGDRWRVEPGDYAGREYTIEGDHSSASYFLAAAAIAGGRVRVENLDPASPQPDAVFSQVLERVGCRVVRGRHHVEVEGTGRVVAFDEDLAGAPDLAPTLAMLGMFAEGPSTVRGIAHLRHKESDRLELLARNLRALGRPAEARHDRLEIGSREGPLRATTIVTESDHRLAMAFAVAGLRIGGLTVDDAGCVAKSNPQFWEQFAALEGSV